MMSSGMLRRVALVKTDVSEEPSAFIKVTIGELGTTLAVTSNRRTLRRKKYLIFLRSARRLLVTGSVVPSSPILVTLMTEELSSSETSVLTRATRRKIPEDTILYMKYACIIQYMLMCCHVPRSDVTLRRDMDWKLNHFNSFEFELALELEFL
jgi:hypothetical protein